METSDGFIRRRFRRPTLFEALAVAAIVAALAALFFPTSQWAASGSIQVPVRVVVFDAARSKPISNAHVAIFHAPPLLDLTSLETERDLYDPNSHVRDGDSATTDANGMAVIEYEFRTGANHERPTMYAKVGRAWVHVQAAGYGGVVVPVRHESLPTKTLHEMKELLVPVGLMAEY